MAPPIGMIKKNRTWIVCAFVLAAYIVLRLAALPEEPQYAAGFRHDSGYLTIVARNLLAGRGLTLDALWLVFLQPARLPMPYHNANPLFPILMAGWTKLFGTDVILSGFVLSALASAGLIAGLTLLLLRYLQRLSVSFAIAMASALFPEVWGASWFNLTDELWAALVIAFVAALVRSDRPRNAALAGVFWGLAWLTRSLAVMLIPAAVAWMWRTLGWRKTISRGAVMGSAALVVCAPWLAHNARTWGSPFRSDNSYLMATHAYHSGRYGGSAVRVWHLPDPPAPFGQVLREHTGAVIRRWIEGVVPLVKVMVRGAAAGSYIAAALLAALTAALGYRRRRSWASPDAAGLAVYGITLAGSLAILGTWTESRYFIAVYALFSAWLFTGIHQELRTFFNRGRDWLSAATVVAAAVYLGFFMFPAALSSAREQRQRDLKYNVPYMRAARRMNDQIARGGPVIVGFHPYLYTVATGAQALCIPQSGDDYLLSYMRKYHARHILLSEEELVFWRPSWTVSGGLPGSLSPPEKLDGYYAYTLAGE